MELDKTVSVLRHIQNGSGQQSFVSEHKFRADTAFFPRSDQRLPDIILSSYQKKHLDQCAGVLFCPVEPGRNDLRIIKNQTVSVSQVVDHLHEMLVSDFACPSVQNHQPGGASVLQRILRDQLLRQIIIKITCFHLTPHPSVPGRNYGNILSRNILGRIPPAALCRFLQPPCSPRSSWALLRARNLFYPRRHY